MGRTTKIKKTTHTCQAKNNQSNKMACPKGAYHFFNLAFTWPCINSFSHCSPITAVSRHPFPLDSAQLPLQGPAHSQLPSPPPYVFNSSSNHTQASRSRWLVGSSRSSMKGRMKRALKDREGDSPSVCWVLHRKDCLACYLQPWSGLA